MLALAHKMHCPRSQAFARERREIRFHLKVDRVHRCRLAYGTIRVTTCLGSFSDEIRLTGDLLGSI